MGKLISVLGSPSSGKTTFSIKLAKELASDNKNVIIIFADNLCPVLPTLKSKVDKSLGELTSTSNFSKELLIKNLETIDKVNNIAILGYKEYENIYTYPKYDFVRVKEIFTCATQIADYVIVDTSSHFSIDIISGKSLEIADKVIKLITPNLKSINYINSNLSMLDSRFNVDKHINILSKYRFNDPTESIESIYDIRGRFMYFESIREQSMCSELFFKLNRKDEIKQSNEMKKIIDLIDDKDLVQSEIKKATNNKNSIFKKIRIGGVNG
ncbi:MAG: hypothetical protein ACRCXT_21305 [Paraclostridium sp.]